MAIQTTESPETLVRRLFSRISEVSTLPTVAVKIIEVANDPTTGAEDLLGAVQFDTALAARIMRTVNSSYYSMQNKVADLKLAITLLGFKEIRNLAMTAYIAQLFKKGSGHGTYTREGLWNHMIGVGIVAQLVAETCRRVPPREAYLAGLLHDIGLILEDQYLNKPFCKVIDLLTENTLLRDVEHKVMGFDHAELGEYVASQWSLPRHLTATIRYHHSPLEYEGEHRDMVFVVALADFFCNVKGLTQLGVRNMQMPPPEIFAALELSKEHISQIWTQLDDTLKSADVMALIHSA